MTKHKQLYKDGIITKEAYIKILNLEFERLKLQRKEIKDKIDKVIQDLKEIKNDGK